ncbi:PAS domain S-box protein [Pseudomonas sp. GZD-222]|uniref:PAS domain S-box protein n=1 Tax=Pseudomonas sp. GZD-222 TaxID=3404805 RepID=UPI003BB77F43
MSLKRLSSMVAVCMLMVGALCISSIWWADQLYRTSLVVSRQLNNSCQAAERLRTAIRERAYFARMYASSGSSQAREKYFELQRSSEVEKQALRIQESDLQGEEAKLLIALEKLQLQQSAEELLAIRETDERGRSERLNGATYTKGEFDYLNTLGAFRYLKYLKKNQKLTKMESKAKTMQFVAAFMLGISILYAVSVAIFYFGRYLLSPIQQLINQTKRLQAGGNGGEPITCLGGGEVRDLAIALEGFRQTNSELNSAHSIKNKESEITIALQGCATERQFIKRLRELLDKWLDVVVVELRDEGSIKHQGLLNYHYPLEHGRWINKFLSISIDHPLSLSQLQLLDALPGAIEPLWQLVAQRSSTSNLLRHSQAQAEKLTRQSIELKARHQALKERESWFRSIVELAPDGIIVFGQHGQVILANSGCEQMFGYQHGGLIGCEFKDLIPKHLNTKVFALDTEYFYGTTAKHMEGMARKSNGSEFPVEISFTLLPSRLEEAHFLCVSIRDMTQRKLYEQNLAFTHDQQKAIFDASPYGLAFIREDCVIQANQFLERLLGCNEQDLLNQSPIDWLGQDVWNQHEKTIRALLSQGEVFCKDIQLFRKDGSQFWASLSICSVQPDSFNYGTIWVIQDITLQRTAAMEIKATRELTEEDMRVKATFVANTCHEIRTPMNAIIGYTHLLLDTQASDQQKDYLRKIKKCSHHLLDILNDILDFSKIESGKLILDCHSFNLRQLVEEVADLQRLAIQQKGISLAITISESIPDFLYGDSLRIKQVLLNYLSNAQKFTDSGCISVKVDLVEQPVDGFLIRFEVTDTGIGLSESQALRVFEGFEQADASTTRNYGGTGLGLAIAKQLTILMGGEVGVICAAGKGSTFWFTIRLPIAQTHPLDHPRPVLNRIPNFDQDRVLLVEDNEMNQEVAVAILRSVGCHVDVANNGQDALDTLKAGSFDLVLMDMHMPVMDGLTATRKIRNDSGIRNIPIIAMTANARQDDREACLSSGMNDFISKPFTPDKLYAYLEKWLKKSKYELSEINISSLESLDGLNVDVGVRRAMGQRALYITLLKLFSESQSKIAEQLSQALEDRNLTGVFELAHNCKGSAATIGAGGIEEAAALVEKSLQQGVKESEALANAHTLLQRINSLICQLKFILD